MIPLPIRRLPHNPDLPPPTYASAGAAGMDVRACLPDGPATLAQGVVIRIPTGFAFAVPEGYEMQVRARSGLSTREGLILPNAPGTIDGDYRGELFVALLRMIPGACVLSHGDRIAQLVLAPVARAAPVETDRLGDTARGVGGFGSTGLSDPA